MSDTGTTYEGELPITQELWEEMDGEILLALTDIEKDYKVKITDLRVVRGENDQLLVKTEEILSAEEPVDASNN